MDAYRSKDWAEFRRQVIALDGFTCSVCGRGETAGVVLQVHHRKYLASKKPWQYPFDLCTTLCKGCHAAEHGLIPPKFDWEFAGWDDLGSPVGTCDCCGAAIRYAFLVTHAAWGPMEVGETCCDNLTSSQVASGFMESKRRYASRLRRFVSSSRWNAVAGGVLTITQSQLLVSLVPTNGGYRLVLNGVAGKTLHVTIHDAKIAAFEVIESGAAKKFLAKRGRLFRRR